MSQLLNGFSAAAKKLEMNIRPAVESDYEAVVELSEGIYEGLVYLPVVFHEWLAQQERVLLVAVLGGKIVGTESIFVVDEGKTAICGAWRIHPRYRSRGLGFQIHILSVEYIKHNYPKVFQLRGTAFVNSDPERMILQCSYMSFYVTKDCTIPDEPLKGISDLKLSRYSKQDFSDVILDKPVAEVLFKKHLHIVDWEPFEAERYNLDLMVKEGDCLLADQSVSAYSKGIIPKSFSHGRLCPRVAYLEWITGIYTDEPALFAAHLLQQISVARQIIEGDFVFSFLCAEEHKDYGRELCEDKLALKLREINARFVRQGNLKEDPKILRCKSKL